KQIHWGYVKPLIVIILMVTLIIFSMSFRGNQNLISSFQTGRVFFTLFVSFVIYVQISKSKYHTFLLKIIKFTAYYYSFIIFLNTLNPSVVQNFFPGIGTMVNYDSWNVGGVRYVIKSNSGILFIYLHFLFLLFAYLTHKKKSNIYQVIILGLAILLQGWRAPIIGIIIGIIRSEERRVGKEDRIE